MEDIKRVLKKLVPNIEYSKEQWSKELKSHPEINTLITTNNISEKSIETSLNLIFQYIEEKNNCSKCKSINECPNLLKGNYTKLEYFNGQFQTKLHKCAKQENLDNEAYKNRLFKSQYIPKELLNASFIGIEGTPGREAGLAALMEFCDKYNKNDGEQRGIYIYGPLGVGKSRMLVATANKLAEKGISTLMVYTPDFFREMKQSIGNNSIEEKIVVLKNIEVLILDDIGAETISQWERDEILGAILQARMTQGLPTLYSSNLDYKDLEEHLAYSNKGGEERLKAARLMERVRHYTESYFVDGPNRRKL